MTEGKQLPRGWRWARLGEVATYWNGRAFKPGEWIQEGIPIIRIENLNSPEATYNHFRGEALPQHLVQHGDLLVSWSASLDAYIWDRGPAVLNQHIFKVEESSTLVLRDFLYFMLRHAMARIRKRVHGATMQHITKPDFERIDIPLPSLAEQQRIAAVLREQMVAVAKARAAARDRLDAVKALPAAFLRQVFGDSPAFAASPVTPTGPVHPGWTWHRLTGLARLATGHTPSRYHPEYWRGAIPWLQLADIRALDGHEAQETSEHANELGIENSSAVLLPAGTVCMSRTASVGFFTIMGRPMATSQDFVNWVCGDALDPWFLMYLLIANRKRIRDLGSGAVHQTIYFPTVQAFSVCVPPIAAQRRLAGVLREQIGAAERACAAAEEELGTINALPAALLRRAFAGEI